MEYCRQLGAEESDKTSQKSASLEEFLTGLQAAGELR